MYGQAFYCDGIARDAVRFRARITLFVVSTAEVIKISGHRSVALVRFLQLSIKGLSQSCAPIATDNLSAFFRCGRMSRIGH